ncbi:vegetative cell wall protein gp1-like [Ananas comosus]|uniref:Vegetative cell wall protein gp1-like n=1 Tax=Ananas comosus TaxID=4615 RepID=A0A6P5HI26_ANACO|nr:vegetative cell wall protein gp1-like [Ananas comosus]
MKDHIYIGRCPPSLRPPPRPSPDLAIGGCRFFRPPSLRPPSRLLPRSRDPVTPILPHSPSPSVAAAFSAAPSPIGGANLVHRHPLTDLVIGGADLAAPPSPPSVRPPPPLPSSPISRLVAPILPPRAAAPPSLRLLPFVRPLRRCSPSDLTIGGADRGGGRQRRRGNWGSKIGEVAWSNSSAFVGYTPHRPPPPRPFTPLLNLWWRQGPENESYVPPPLNLWWRQGPENQVRPAPPQSYGGGQEPENESTSRILKKSSKRRCSVPMAAAVAPPSQWTRRPSRFCDRLAPILAAPVALLSLRPSPSPLPIS